MRNQDTFTMEAHWREFNLFDLLFNDVTPAYYVSYGRHAIAAEIIAAAQDYSEARQDEHRAVVNITLSFGAWMHLIDELASGARGTGCSEFNGSRVLETITYTTALAHFSYQLLKAKESN